MSSNRVWCCAENRLFSGMLNGLAIEAAVVLGAWLAYGVYRWLL